MDGWTSSARFRLRSAVERSVDGRRRGRRDAGCRREFPEGIASVEEPASPPVVFDAGEKGSARICPLCSASVHNPLRAVRPPGRSDG